MQAMTASERAFAGALLNGDARAADFELRTDDFADPVCRQVFSVCATLEAKGKAHDLPTVSDAAPGLDVSALVELMGEAAPEAALIGQHAQTIREAAQRRQAVSVLSQAVRAAADTGRLLPDVLSTAREALDKLSGGVAQADSSSGTDVLCELYSYLTTENPEPPISTGLPRLDACFGGGLRGGKFIVVGARPSVGKSALMSFVAVRALQAGRRVLYISLEMEPREVASRMMALVSGVSAGKLEARRLSDGDMNAVVESFSLLPGEHLRVSTSATTPGAVRRAALRMRAAGGIDMVFVDYLQLMRVDGKTNGRVEAVGEISRLLKSLALELGIPVIAAAQVNRQSTQGEERAPRLSELRESGSIEQDADVVILLHAPGLQQQERRLIVAKNRQGRCGTMDLLFDGARMKFVELEKRFEEAV